jgi:hypothetical protein
MLASIICSTRFSSPSSFVPVCEGFHRMLFLLFFSMRPTPSSTLVMS